MSEFEDLGKLVQSFVRSLPMSFIVCRMDLHTFPYGDEDPDTLVDPGDIRRERVRFDGIDCTRVTRVCQRCRTAREQTFARDTWEQVGPTLYPGLVDGYMSPHGRIPRAVIRKEWNRRLDAAERQRRKAK